ncbi:hypothetical protein HYFRA_00012607 [Hymenoscyphus fraxineus]|uniref:Uncharacterized protein n=1 Tax=Hymenoscyphus fraxineus TaxID=746836 RepID=A0A9N9L4D7_9HELO|nr:hypothetical protein HYFRA_00012607 [Hymenoscyphus fraxineus]
MQFRNLLVIATLATSVSAAGYSWAYCQNLPSGTDDITSTAIVCNTMREQFNCDDCETRQALLDPDHITKCTSSGKKIDPREWASQCRASTQGQGGQRTGVGN